MVISTSIWAQQTNIENLPRPKIDDENLKTLYLNDGEKIELVPHAEAKLTKWKDEQVLSKKPTVVVMNSGDYVYNYYAVHNLKLCPLGQNVIRYNDVRNLSFSSEDYRQLILSQNNTWIDINYNCEDSTTTASTEFDAYLGSFNVLDADQENKFEALKFNYNGISARTLAVYDFLPTRCVEDLTYSFKNKVYSYASLMPQKFNQLKQRLAQEALFRSQNTNLDGNQGNFNVGFNHSGENVSTLSSNQNQDFWNSLMPIVKNKQHLPSPYYESIFLSTKDAITVKILEIDDYAKMQKGKKEAFHYKTYFTSPGDEINFSKLNDTWIKNRYSTNRFGNVTNLDQFFNFTATVKEEPFKYQVYINNIKQNNPTYFVSKFHLSGSLTPLKSLVFPGLGSKTLRFDNIHKTHKALAITSLALSAISLTVSEVFYQDYRRNINSEPFSKNYDIANSLHKVGLVSLGIYPVISISDILSCYIKCKNDGIQLAGNKRIQRQVNKEINDNRRKNIYLCRD